MDDENRERLAKALLDIQAVGAQLVITSYDQRFCTHASRLTIPGGVEHLGVEPATLLQPVVRTTPPLKVLEERREKFEADQNAEEPARLYADGCRVFLEAKLGSMFDDPSYSAWAMANRNPSLSSFVQRLRQLVPGAPLGMFSAHVFQSFIKHPGVADGAPVLALMNKSHHGQRDEIRPADVSECANDLAELTRLAEGMFDECSRWRRRDDAPSKAPVINLPPPPIPPTIKRQRDIWVCPDLAAFTEHTPTGDSQEVPELLDPRVWEGKTLFYLRRPNFGFAAPEGSLAIVDAMPGPATDRQLVIARHADIVYARRAVRSATSNIIAFTAEVPDPRKRNPKTVMLLEEEVAVHRVVGIIFEPSLTFKPGNDEAVHLDSDEILKRVEVGFRIVDDSAVPLALDKQVVLGGPRIDLAILSAHKGSLVALNLEDGSSLFKRVGEALPGDLAHLLQFESIGGLGSSQILAVSKEQQGILRVTSARQVIGVLYEA